MLRPLTTVEVKHAPSLVEHILFPIPIHHRLLPQPFHSVQRNHHRPKLIR